jgi:hypothetical protein
LRHIFLICTSRRGRKFAHGGASVKQLGSGQRQIEIVGAFPPSSTRMFFVGNPSAADRKLVEVTQESMMRGIAEIKPGVRVGDIGAAI